jgi:hypothetical protein
LSSVAALGLVLLLVALRGREGPGVWALMPHCLCYWVIGCGRPDASDRWCSLAYGGQKLVLDWWVRLLIRQESSSLMMEGSGSSRLVNWRTNYVSAQMTRGRGLSLTLSCNADRESGGRLRFSGGLSPRERESKGLLPARELIESLSAGEYAVGD